MRLSNALPRAIALTLLALTAMASSAQKLTKEQKKEQKQADAALQQKLEDSLRLTLKMTRFQAYATGDGTPVTVKEPQPGTVYTVPTPNSIPATRLIHRIPAPPSSNADAILNAIGGLNKPHDDPESFVCYLPTLFVLQGGLLPGEYARERRDCSRDLTAGTARYLDVGEKVLVISVGVQPAGDRVLFSLVTYNPDADAAPTGSVEYFAKIGLQYPHGYLNSLDAAQIIKDLNTVITPDSVAVAPAAAPLAQPAPMPPPPPPAAPPAAPQTASIELGMTTDQVTSAMGQPQRIIKLGAKSIFIYDGIKITFLNGKVSAMQ